MKHKLDYILDLYSKYKEKLIEAKNFSLMAKNVTNFKPMFDDLENEITFLLNVDNKPNKIVEFSPAYGWSTITLCLAVKNNNKGHVYTYDIQDKCVENLNKVGLSEYYTFKKGDVSTQFNNFMDADYIFIDSDHSAGFARKYINELINPILKTKQKTTFCIHDVFQTDEGVVIQEFLKEQNIEYFSPKHNIDALNKHKSDLGINIQLHNSIKNPSVFFNF